MIETLQSKTTSVSLCPYCGYFAQMTAACKTVKFKSSELNTCTESCSCSVLQILDYLSTLYQKRDKIYRVLSPVRLQFCCLMYLLIHE